MKKPQPVIVDAERIAGLAMNDLEASMKYKIIIGQTNDNQIIALIRDDIMLMPDYLDYIAKATQALNAVLKAEIKKQFKTW